MRELIHQEGDYKLLQRGKKGTDPTSLQGKPKPGNSNAQEGVAPPTICLSKSTPAIRSGRGAKTDQRGWTGWLNQAGF
ncbi:MAG: hypothetical protein M1386_01805 [Candidatus Thermoplasmatota archaeon]|nr:hypothetical protein [Candidatus Thermoplasmatota archaeon]